MITALAYNLTSMLVLTDLVQQIDVLGKSGNLVTFEFSKVQREKMYYQLTVKASHFPGKPSEYMKVSFRNSYESEYVRDVRRAFLDRYEAILSNH